MALIVNTNLRNDAGGYLVDAKNVKGTYVVVANATERDALLTDAPDTMVEGTLCYVSGESKAYRLTSDAWVEEVASGKVDDVQINSTSILSDKTANFITNTAYDKDTNKIATMTDINNAIGAAMEASY